MRLACRFFSGFDVKTMPDYLNNWKSFFFKLIDVSSFWVSFCFYCMKVWKNLSIYLFGPGSLKKS